jgi:hypothetical protein
MHRRKSNLEMEVNCYATNQVHAKDTMDNLWNHFVPNPSAICGVKPELSALKALYKPKKNLSHHPDLCELVTSLLIRAMQMGEMSKLG